MTRREVHQHRCAWLARLPYTGRECIAALQFQVSDWDDRDVRQAEAVLAGGCIDAPSIMPAGAMQNLAEQGYVTHIRR